MRPRELSVRANGLEHVVLEWGDAGAARTAVLLHGYMDAAGTWGDVAPGLVEGSGLRVLAHHQRGFGRGPRVPGGAYYHFPDYVFDLADVIDACAPGARVSLVGHSMGGTVATLYAGAFPERVERLALLEGTGPLDNPFETAPTRMRRWIEDVRRARGQASRPVGTADEALSRLAQNHGGIARETLARRLPELVAVSDQGLASWLFDPLHRTLSPMPFYAEAYKAFARRVTCPVLAIDGGPEGYQPPDERERLACFADVRTATLPGAGHMLHWTQPDALVALLAPFLADASPREGLRG